MVEGKCKCISFVTEIYVEKNKQSKIAHLDYEGLKMQEYLMEGNKNTKLSQLIFRTRERTLAIKTHKKWKFDDNICLGCDDKIEIEDEFLTCRGLGDRNEMKWTKLIKSKKEDISIETVCSNNS